MQRDVNDARGFTVVYDPSTERLEWELKEDFEFSRATPEEAVATFEVAVPGSLLAGIPPSIRRRPTTFSTKRLNGMNNALNVLVDMKDFGIHKNSYAGMSDRQIKESLAASQGIPIKGGRSSSLGGVTDIKIEELKDVNRLQQEQTGTVLDIDRVFTFDPDSNSFVQTEE